MAFVVIQHNPTGLDVQIAVFDSKIEAVIFANGYAQGAKLTETWQHENTLLKYGFRIDEVK